MQQLMREQYHIEKRKNNQHYYRNFGKRGGSNIVFAPCNMCQCGVGYITQTD